MPSLAAVRCTEFISEKFPLEKERDPDGREQGGHDHRYEEGVG